MTPYWRSLANCRGEDPNLWFSYPGTPEYREAESLCARCPVTEECAAEGERHEEWGRWGTYQKLEGRRHPQTVGFHCETCEAQLVSEDGGWVCGACRGREERAAGERQRVRRVRAAWWKPRANHRMLTGMDLEEARRTFDSWSDDEYRAG